MADDKPAQGESKTQEPCLEVNEEGLNAKAVWCQWCETKVMLGGAAKLVEHEVFLPSVTYDKGADPNGKGDTYASVWLLTSRYAFENVGVSRPVVDGAPVTKETDASFRYLTCAECERGPIGLIPDLGNREGEHYYVAPARVRVKDQ